MQRGIRKPLHTVTKLPVLLETTGAYDGLWGVRKVRIVWPEEINSEKKIKNALGDEGWKCFAGTVALKHAYDTRDPIQMQRGYKLLAAGRGLPPRFVADASALTKTPVRSIEYFLPDFVNQELQKTHVLLWWNSKRKKLMPGIMCPDFPTAVYAMYLLGQFGLRNCPNCGTWFEAKRSDQMYHKIQCREAHRVKRWRAKERSK
jgi:hypothetical protein